MENKKLNRSAANKNEKIGFFNYAKLHIYSFFNNCCKSLVSGFEHFILPKFSKINLNCKRGMFE